MLDETIMIFFFLFFDPGVNPKSSVVNVKMYILLIVLLLLCYLNNDTMKRLKKERMNANKITVKSETKRN